MSTTTDHEPVLTRRQGLGLGAAAITLTGVGALLGKALNPKRSSTAAPTSSGTGSTGESSPMSTDAGTRPRTMPALVGKNLASVVDLGVRLRIRFVDRPGAVTVLAQSPKAGTPITQGTIPTLTASGHLTTVSAATILGSDDGILRLTGARRITMPARTAQLRMSISAKDGVHTILIRTSHGVPVTRRNVTASTTRLTLAVDNAEWVEFEPAEDTPLVLTVHDSELTKAP